MHISVPSLGRHRFPSEIISHLDSRYVFIISQAQRQAFVRVRLGKSLSAQSRHHFKIFAVSGKFVQLDRKSLIE